MKERGNIVLLGLKSSGKTTIGKFLGRALGKAWFDLDDLATDEYRREAQADPAGHPLRFAKDAFPPREIHARHGEAFFRELEAAAFGRFLGDWASSGPHGGTGIAGARRESDGAAGSGGVVDSSGAALSGAAPSGSSDRPSASPALTGWVLSTGGGFASNKVLREKLSGNEGLYVWLLVPEEVLFERMLAGSGLPTFLAGGTTEQARQKWAEIYAARLEDGLALADVTVDLGNLGVDAACKKTLNVIQELVDGR